MPVAFLVSRLCTWRVAGHSNQARQGLEMLDLDTNDTALLAEALALESARKKVFPIIGSPFQRINIIRTQVYRELH